jgi:hypothetical protein
MNRASAREKAERLNYARKLLQRFDYLPDAVARMVKRSGISPRQAYRYLQQAQLLAKPVPVGDLKVALRCAKSSATSIGLRHVAGASRIEHIVEPVAMVTPLIFFCPALPATQRSRKNADQ